MSAKRVVAVLGVAIVLLVSAWLFGRVAWLMPLQAVLSALVLVGILVAGMLGVLSLNQLQDRAEGLAEEAEEPSRLDRAKEWCLPFASLSGLVVSATVAAMSFALLCHGLYNSGLEHWFTFTRPGEHPLWEWTWFSFLQAFRAADLPDMLETQALDYGFEMPKLLRPISGETAAAVSLISGYRIAIGTLLISQAISIWLRRRRIQKAVEALRDPDTREHAKRTLKLNSANALGPLGRVFRHWRRPPRRHSGWIGRLRRRLTSEKRRQAEPEPDWLLAALDVCRSLGTDAAQHEDAIWSLLDGDSEARLQQAAVVSLASVTRDPVELVLRIHDLWADAETMEEEQRVAWKGTLGRAIERCKERLLDDPEANLEAISGRLEEGSSAESTTWLLWHLSHPPESLASWPMVALFAGARQPSLIKPGTEPGAVEIRTEPLEESDEPLDLDACVRAYPGEAQLPQKLEIRLGNGVAMSFLLVPAGLYQRGNVFDADTGDNIERPCHPVALRSPFYLQDTQVTYQQFGRFLDSEAGKEFRERLGEQKEESDDEDWYDVVEHYDEVPDSYADHPLSYASWFDGRVFCQWLTDEHVAQVNRALPERARPILATLPTEAEWEWAAKGPGLYQFPWGNDLDQKQLRFFIEPYDVDPPATVPVRSYEGGRSWCGHYDMAGNLYCWADDQFKDYSRFSQEALNDDPVGISRYPSRVQRGGAWCYTDWDSRCTYRYATQVEESREEDGGFRVALVFGRPRAL